MKKYFPNGETIPGVSFIWPTQVTDAKIEIEIGDNVIFRPPCIIYWGVKLGNNVIISHNAVIREFTIVGNNSKIGNGTTLDGHLTIGKFVSIHTNCFVASKTIIEDYVFIGPGCTITNTKKIKHTRKFPLIEDVSKIEYGARIGGGCTICPGVTIGREALVGAGSVILKDIPPFKKVYGLAAKIQGDVPLDERL